MKPYMKAVIGLTGWAFVGIYFPGWVFLLYMIVFIRYFQDFVMDNAGW